MAVITCDTSGAGPKLGTGSSITVATFTVGNNAGCYLLVGLWSTGGSSIPTPSYAGAAMTSLLTGTTGSTSWAIFGLLAPATGSNNLTATLLNGGAFGFLYYSLYNASSAQPDNTGNSGASSGTSVSLSITPSNDSDMVVFFGFTSNTISSLTGAGANNQTSSNCQGNASGNITGIVGNSGAVTPPSLQSATLNLTSSNYQLLAVCVKPQLQTNSALSLTMGSAASRTDSISKSQALNRAASIAMFNSASRLIQINSFRILTRVLSSVVLSFSAIVNSLGGIWKNSNKDASVFVNQNKSTP